MRVQRLLPVLVAFGLLPALATPAMAQRAYRSRSMEHGSEFSPYLTFNQFQSKAELDDEFGAGFRFGYLYTPHHEIEFMLNSVSTKDSVFTSDNVDLTNLQVA